MLDYSSDRVLTTEFIDGCKPTDLKAIRAMNFTGYPEKETAQTLCEAFALQIYRFGFVHADPHPGNIIIRRNPDNPGRPQVCLIDHVGSYLISKKNIFFFSNIFNFFLAPKSI